MPLDAWKPNALVYLVVTADNDTFDHCDNTSLFEFEGNYKVQYSGNLYMLFGWVLWVLIPDAYISQ